MQTGKDSVFYVTSPTGDERIEVPYGLVTGNKVFRTLRELLTASGHAALLEQFVFGVGGGFKSRLTPRSIALAFVLAQPCKQEGRFA